MRRRRLRGADGVLTVPFNLLARWQTGEVAEPTTREARRAEAVLDLVVLVLVVCLASACTGHHDDPDPPSSATGVRLGGNPPESAITAPAPNSPLANALAAVPPSVLYASFTDVAAVRRDLGYADVDSQSPAGQRFAFWEDARASGTMLTGTRLYGDVSEMESDYGWTADDVAWEIDFSGDETGCLEDMICDPSGGSVIALSPDVTARTIIESLSANGFTLETGGQIWTTAKTGGPFRQAIYLANLNAVALGNEIGLRRIEDVAGGAPSLADQLPALTDALGSPVSAYVDTTGCVSLGEALGPDATDDDRAAFAKRTDASGLATASAWAVGIESGRQATSLLDLTPDDAAVDPPVPVTPEQDAIGRADVLDHWKSVQAGVDFGDVARAVVGVPGPLERVSYEVDSMPTFAAMVLTHDAPWALCPTDAS
jgi:hypothetical protein